MLFRLTQLCLLLLTGMLLTACAPQYSGKQPPKVINGEIDLTGWDFEKDGPVKLDGDWLFAWEKFVEPGSWDEIKKQMLQSLQVPAFWDTLEDPVNAGQQLPGKGYASFALKIKGSVGNETLGYLVPDALIAMTVFSFNRGGVLVDRKNFGTPSDTLTNEKPLEYVKKVVYLLRKDGINEYKEPEAILLIHVSNLRHFRGGQWSVGTLGLFNSLDQQLTEQNQFQDFMVGLLLIVGVYHLILFSLRRQDKPALFFGLYCISLTLRIASMGVAQRAGYNDTVFAWIFLTKLEYGSIPLMGLGAIVFFHSLVPKKPLLYLSYFLFVTCIPLTVLVAFSTTAFFPAYLNFFNLHIGIALFGGVSCLFYHALEKDTTALLLLLSLLVVGIGVLNDILYSYLIIQTAYIAPYVTIVFVLFQAGIISYRNAKAYKTAEHLSEKLSEEVEEQTKKLNRIQYLSQQIQNTSDLDSMINNLNNVLNREFLIPGYNLFLLNKERKQLESIKFETNYKLPQNVKSAIFQSPIDLSHPKSLHGSLIKKEKPYFLPRLLNVENAPDEMQYREFLGMKSLFFLPLKVDGEVFAFLSMLDTKFQDQDRIRYLTKEERKDIEQLSQFVSSALYQALQKEQIQKAKDEAEQAQVAASRAKNEAAINQLAAHLAHEVNNPLNYIATGKTIQSDSFDKYHEMILDVLTGDDEDSRVFKEELEKLQDKFIRGLEQTNEGQDRIAKVIAEIRAITGVDGLNFTNFDIVPIINEEMVYSLQRNQVKIGEQAIKVTGTDSPIEVLSNQHILARSIRTVISNCIHFAREHKGNEGELYINCRIKDNLLLIEIGNNSFSIKTKQLNNLFDLEKSKSHGTEQIGLAMIKELLHKVNAELVLADHGRESGKVIFQMQVPLEI